MYHHVPHMLPTTDECYHLPILAIRFSKESTAKARDTKVDDQLGETCVGFNKIHQNIRVGHVES